jgi:hypothetical protein
LNLLSGPDFSEAKIYLEQLYCNGAVELHISASDRFLQLHQNDSAYDNVILDVVCNFDSDVYYPNGKPTLTIEMSNYVAIEALKSKESCFLKKPQFIPYEKKLDSFSTAQCLSCQVGHELMKTV